MSVNGDQRMLPIWHDLPDEIARQSPSLVDRIARSASVNTVAEIADDITEVVQDGVDA
jgi:hypothetical protein